VQPIESDRATTDRPAHETEDTDEMTAAVLRVMHPEFRHTVWRFKEEVRDDRLRQEPTSTDRSVPRSVR
jgi:hypothetical protein